MMEVLEGLFNLLGVVAPLAIAVTLIVLGLLSQRLGAVTHTPPYYRWFYVAAVLVAAAGFFQILYVLSVQVEATGLLHEENFYTLTHSAPLALGLTISAVVSWRYWGWLLGERSK
jgi:hypothetical protein